MWLLSFKILYIFSKILLTSVVTIIGEMQISMVIAFPFDSQVKELSCQDGLIQPEQ